MTVHVVTGAAVKVSIGGAGGNRLAQFLRRDDIVPAGLDEAQIDRLVGRGLIAELPPIDPALEQATTAVFDAAVKAEAERVIQAEFVPIFDQRVQDAAAKLVAEQTPATGTPAAEVVPPVAPEPEAPASKPRAAK